MVFSLTPRTPGSGGSLSHLGLRVPDVEALDAVRCRPEAGGLPSQRQEGTVCGYARQTKFWVTDPDRNLWEVYVFEEDLDHSGFVDPPRADTLGQTPATVVWEYRLTEPVPSRVSHPDGSVDEVRPEGSFNAAPDGEQQRALLAESRRVLRPGGRRAVHGLVGDRPFPGRPDLPGPASLVRHIPTQTDLLDAPTAAGFGGLLFEKPGDIHCFRAGAVELREARLVGVRPSEDEDGPPGDVLYKGPFEQVMGDDGTVYPRGERVRVPAVVWHQLRIDPAAEQSLFFPAGRP